MAKIPFDIKYRPQIESGEYKVETRDGRSVRIICWDKQEYAGQREEPTPIVYLLLSKGGCENIMICATDGMYSDGLERDSDLFIVTPELTEFELKLLDWLSSDTCGEIPMEKMKECVKARASELLDLARKELVDAMQLQFDNEINEAYYRGRKDGKAEALKDLPRWEDIKTGDRVLIHCKSTRDEALKHIYDNQEGKVLHIWDLKGNSWGNIHVKIEGGYNNGFLLEELEKLPGFKEDSHE